MRTLSIFYCLSIGFLLFSCEDSDDGAVVQEIEMMMEEEVVARTAIPDPVFEQYFIDRDMDDVIDGFVDTERLLQVDQIVVDDLGITDLKGIEACPNLYNLWLQNNNVNVLNVSQNPKLQFLYADGNNLAAINVSSTPLLEKLSLRNNTLETLDVSNNIDLELLEISGNQIDALTVTENTALFRLDVSDNPLVCIEVNEAQLANDNLQWTLDTEDALSLDCN